MFQDYAGLDAVANFGAIGVQVPLAVIYKRVRFEPLVTLAKMTPEEYLDRERLAESKSEYHDGVVVAWRRPSQPLDDSDVTTPRRDCQPFSSEMRVWAPAANSFF